MKGASVLKKITSRAKQLKKKNPGKKWSTLVKQAGSEFRAGKLKKKRRKPVKKAKRRTARRKVSAVSGVRRVVRRRTRRRRAVAKPKVIIRTRTRIKTVRVGSRVGAKKSIMPLLLIGGGLLAAYMLLKPKTQQPILVTTGNAARDSTAANILSYASAAGATATAIAKLIAAINASNDAQVNNLHTAIQAAPNLSDDSSVQAILMAQGAGNIAGPSPIRVIGY